MRERAEIVVVGGGIMGAAIAHGLAARGRDVLLLERSGLASGPTGRSTAMVRVFYSHAFLVRMALHGLRTYSTFPDAIGGSCGWQRTGVVWAVEESVRPALERNVSLGQAEGATIELIDADALAALDPRIATDDLAGLAFEAESGHCDPYLATAGFAAAARRLGAEIEEGVRVTAVRPGSVETDRGTVSAGAVVVAAGVWSVPLVAALGFELPLSAVGAQVGRFRLPAGFDPPPPALADFSRLLFYLKRGEPGYLEIGSLDPHDVDAAVDPDSATEGAERQTLDRYAAAIARRIPAAAPGHWRGAWTGIYDVSPDWQPAIGAVPGVEGVYVAAGFSGHGFKLAPAVGTAVAELVCDGRATSFDLAVLDPERFARGELLASHYGVVG